MKTNVKTVCPYCGTLNAVVFDETESRCIHSCDIESGGCDKDFAVYFDVKITAKAAAISDPIAPPIRPLPATTVHREPIHSMLDVPVTHV